MESKRFATAVNCMDGRIQIPTIDFVRSKTGVDFVDLITQAGVVKVLAKNENASALRSIKEHIGISIEKHLSSNVWVSAHHDCAANPADEAVQINQTRAAVELLRKWFPQVSVSGLWVNKDAKVIEI